MHEILLVPVLMYTIETMIWKEKERSRIRAVQMCRVTKGLMKVFSGGSAMWREWRMIGFLRGCVCRGIVKVVASRFLAEKMK